MKLTIILLALCIPAGAKVNLAGFAAGTTVAVNLLEVRTTFHKVKAVAGRAKRITVKTAKKAVGR